jgi:hypothetical protein
MAVLLPTCNWAKSRHDGAQKTLLLAPTCNWVKGRHDRASTPSNAPSTSGLQVHATELGDNSAKTPLYKLVAMPVMFPGGTIYPP